MPGHVGSRRLKVPAAGGVQLPVITFADFLVLTSLLD
jgi:hypothetical protein